MTDVSVKLNTMQDLSRSLQDFDHMSHFKETLFRERITLIVVVAAAAAALKAAAAADVVP